MTKLKLSSLEHVATEEVEGFREIITRETFLESFRRYKEAQAKFGEAEALSQMVPVNDVVIYSMDDNCRKYIETKWEINVLPRRFEIYDTTEFSNDLTPIAKAIQSMGEKEDMAGSLGHLWYFLSLHGFSRGERGPLQETYTNFYPLGGKPILALNYARGAGWSLSLKPIEPPPPVAQFEDGGEDQRWPRGTRFIIPI